MTLCIIDSHQYRQYSKREIRGRQTQTEKDRETRKIPIAIFVSKFFSVRIYSEAVTY